MSGNSQWNAGNTDWTQTDVSSSGTGSVAVGGDSTGNIATTGGVAGDGNVVGNTFDNDVTNVDESVHGNNSGNTQVTQVDDHSTNDNHAQVNVSADGGSAGAGGDGGAAGGGFAGLFGGAGDGGDGGNSWGGDGGANLSGIDLGTHHNGPIVDGSSSYTETHDSHNISDSFNDERSYDSHDDNSTNDSFNDNSQHDSHDSSSSGLELPDPANAIGAIGGAVGGIYGGAAGAVGDAAGGVVDAIGDVFDDIF